MDVTQPDNELVKKISSSDSSAFEILYRRYYEPLFHFIASRTNDAALARDFVQDVFTQLWVHRETLDPHKQVKSYLFQSAKNRIINHYKSRVIRENAHRELMYFKNDAEITDVFDLEKNIAALIRQLPSETQHIFLLSRRDHLTYPEIADQLNINIKKVERQMSKALSFLRSEFKKITS